MKYCPHCGKETEPVCGEWVCVNPDCEQNAPTITKGTSAGPDFIAPSFDRMIDRLREYCMMNP